MDLAALTMRGNVQLNAGGSLANTLAGLARLASAEHQRHAGATYHSPPLKVGMTGCIGDDHLGDFFRSQFCSAGVHWISEPVPGTGTGTVIVLTTDDAQRSFLSYPGSSTSFDIGPATASAIASSRLLIIEGYLWEFPDAAETISRAIDIAREAGATVAMTVADVSVVQRHSMAMLESIKKADIVFTNRAEATELIKSLPEDHLISKDSPYFGAESAAKQLGSLCPVAVVTDGSKGSCITAVGQLYVVPPDWSRDVPLDTCGAGDAYAAGFLHAFLSGMNIHQMGEFAASTASKVIHRMGPQLSAGDAEFLIASRPDDARLGASIVGPLSRHAQSVYLV